MQLTFGAGEFFAQMIRDAAGNTITTPTPIRIAGLQEFNLDFSGELKEFYGANRFALAVAVGKVKTSGKMKGALINGTALNSLFYGSSNMATGTMKSIYPDTTGITVATSVTTTPPNSGTFAEDLGVIDGATGILMTRVASAPATGQYSVDESTGTYTFASADVGKTVYRSYSYTYTLTTAKKIPLENLAMGQAPAIKAFYVGQYAGKKAMLELNSITSTKLMLFAGKNDDFSVPELDFSASTDAAGYSLGNLYVQE